MIEDDDNDYDLMQQLGRSGLAYYSGYLAEEIVPALTGQRWRKVCKEMQLDSTIGAMLFAFEHLIRQVDFTFVAADDSPKAREYKDFYEAALFKDMSRTWKDTLSEISTFLGWGFAPLELVYKRRSGLTPGTVRTLSGKERPLPISNHNDGLVGWHQWPLRGQETVEKWDFDEFGEIDAMWQLSPPDWKWIQIPMEKLLLFRTTLKKNNPEGQSLLRAAWLSYFFRSNYQRFEGIGVERHLGGLPMMRIPAEILNSQPGTPNYAIRQAYINIATNVRKDEQMGVVIPSDRDEKGNALYEFSLLSTASSQPMDMEPKIQRLDQRILMCVMMDFLLLGHEKVGSFALADNKTDLFITATGSFLDNICDVINRHAVPRLAKLNAFQPELLPQLHHGDIETQDLGILGDYVSKLSSVGALTFPTADGKIEEYLARQASFPVSEHQQEGDEDEADEDQPNGTRRTGGRAPGNGAANLTPAQRQRIGELAEIFQLLAGTDGQRKPAAGKGKKPVPPEGPEGEDDES